MRLIYGFYQHAIAETTIQIDRAVLYNEGGQQYAFEETWKISGFLQAPDQPSITAQIAALQKAYSIQGQNLGFFQDNGQPTAHGVLSKDTLGGVRIVDGPTFDQGQGGEYSTYRYYSITAKFIVPDPRVALLAFQERLSFEGTGGEKVGWLQTLQGPPQRQRLAEVTTVKAVQEGSQVGWLSAAPPMPPLFPLSEHVDRRRINFTSPKRYGPLGRPQWAEYATEWHYEFEDLILVGAPNRWID